jgi:hypothetical protein
MSGAVFDLLEAEVRLNDEMCKAQFLSDTKRKHCKHATDYSENVRTICGQRAGVLMLIGLVLVKNTVI